MKRRKQWIALMMLFVFFCADFSVLAAEVVQIPANDSDSVYYQSVDSNALEGWVQGPQIYCESGIVMDMDSGAILYAKNIDAPHYPASITKVLTALVALENSELTDVVQVKKEDVDFLEPGDSYVGLKPGEEITMEDALHAVLLASANEASHAVASSMEGGYEHFLQLMNDKVKELGGKNSNFTNTHGLHDENHYTSARDMALIGAAAFQNEDFYRITNTLQYTIPVTNITNETRTFQQNHKMLYKWRTQYYEYCEGGKTGYTDQALNTLVTFAVKEDVRLVAVVMRARGNTNAYGDTKKILDYAFENFSKLPVTSDMAKAKGIASLDTGAYVMLPEGIGLDQLKSTVEMPTEIGDKTGRIIYTYGGQPVGEIGMTISDAYYNEIHGIEEKKEEKPEETKKKSVWFVLLQVVLWIVIIALFLFVLLLVYVHYKRRQIRKRRRLRRKNP